MKLKFTPLLLLSVCLALLGLYIIFYSIYIDSNIGPLVGILVIFLAGLCLLASYAIKSIFRINIKTQIALEVPLVVVLIVAFYQFNEKVVLHPQQNFSGYIFIVYEIEKKPAIEPETFFSRTIDVTVPDNGIILTSSKYGSGYTSELTVDDGVNGELRRGYDVPGSIETIVCYGKNYKADVLLIGKLNPGWSYNADTLNRRLKTELICKMLSEE